MPVGIGLGIPATLGTLGGWAPEAVMELELHHATRHTYIHTDIDIIYIYIYIYNIPGGPGGAHQALPYPQLRLHGAHCHCTWPHAEHSSPSGLAAGQCGKRRALPPPPGAPLAKPCQQSPRRCPPRCASPGASVLRRPLASSTLLAAIPGVCNGDRSILGGHGHVAQCEQVCVCHHHLHALDHGVTEPKQCGSTLGLPEGQRHGTLPGPAP